MMANISVRAKIWRNNNGIFPAWVDSIGSYHRACNKRMIPIREVEGRHSNEEAVLFRCPCGFELIFYDVDASPSLQMAVWEELEMMEETE